MHTLTRVGLSAISLLALAVSTALAAPEPQGGQAWSLGYCINAAFDNHGDVLVAVENLDAARAQLRSAGSSLWYPTLSAQSTRTEGQSVANQGGSTQRRTGDISDEQHLLSANVTLWDGGVQRQNVRQAKASQTTVEASMERTRQLLAYEVTNAYVRVLRARRSLEVANRQLEQAQGQKAMVEAKVEAGAAAEVDVFPIEVQIANARVNQIRAHSDIRVAASALRNAMGLESGEVPELEEVPEKLADAPALEECRALALENRPEVRQTEATLERNRASLTLARLRTLPQLTSNARYQRGLASSTIDRQWSINAALSWNFFDRGDRADIDAASANLRAADLQRAQLIKDIGSEVEQAHLALAGARERVAAAEVSLQLARKNLEVAEAKYQADLAIPLEIVDAQVAASNAELQWIEARYDYYLARAQLDRAMGREPGLE